MTPTMYCFYGFVSLLLSSLATSSAIPADNLVRRATEEVSKTKTTMTTSASSTRVADSSCTNGPYTRNCWSNGFSIAADFDKKWPNTGKTRYYDFTLTNETYSPDGGPPRNVFKVNGQYPGPTVYADWGDMISVTLHNRLANNGTGIHWHGIRQLNTNTEDGVPGVTECPLAPGDTKTYLFRATQYGTTWWHTHFAAQYGDGCVGAMVINGPATANYDVDLGPLTISDYYYKPVAALAAFNGRNLVAPPAADNGLINGTMVSSGGGRYHTTTITKGKKYRLRLINTSVDAHYQVSLDKHPFQVITSDFVPIKPYPATWIFIGIGQRYDVIITANQTVGNYWFRAEVQDQVSCGVNLNNGNIKSIFSYASAPAGNPTSSATPYQQRCTDETGLVPFWDSFVPSGPLQTTALNVAINAGVNTLGDYIVTWGINGSGLSVKWEKPLRKYVVDYDTSYETAQNLITLPEAGQWYYWIIQEAATGVPFAINVPHPIHLHGHDFYILGTGPGQYADVDPATLNYDNPPRRDVAMLPENGWLAIAFQTDNPGAWLMHCHIAWHASEGLAVQFLESADKIENVNPSGSAFQKTCDNWNAYYPDKAYYLRDYAESGI